MVQQWQIWNNKRTYKMETSVHKKEKKKEGEMYLTEAD